jgi:hypothetical protein
MEISPDKKTGKNSPRVVHPCADHRLSHFRIVLHKQHLNVKPIKQRQKEMTVDIMQGKVIESGGI